MTWIFRTVAFRLAPLALVLVGIMTAAMWVLSYRWSASVGYVFAVHGNRTYVNFGTGSVVGYCTFSVCSNRLTPGFSPATLPVDAGVGGYADIEKLDHESRAFYLNNRWDYRLLSFGYKARVSPPRPLANGGIYAMTQHRLLLPHWFLIVLCWFPAGWILRAQWRRRRRHRLGQCSSCGYDLRAHKPGEKCPECGADIATIQGGGGPSP